MKAGHEPRAARSAHSQAPKLARPAPRPSRSLSPALDRSVIQQLRDGHGDDAATGERAHAGFGDTVAVARDAAQLGTSGPASSLPHLAQIQKSFGRHDVSGVAAHVDDAAAVGARRMGALAFTTGEHVAFAESPTLRTSAHEAAHVIQQRTGIELGDGLGRTGDRFERHADQVAERVAAGQSSESLLETFASTPGAAGTRGAAPVQRKPRKASGSHHAVVTIRYIDDSTELGHRLVARISRETGIPQEALFQPMFTGASRQIYQALATTHVRSGGSVQIAVEVSYDPERSGVATIERIAPVAPPGTAAAASPPNVVEPPEQPTPDETVEARLRRQARTTVRTLSETVAAADREGFASIHITIQHTGRELVPGFRKEGRAAARPAVPQVSAAEIAKDHLQPLLEMVLMNGVGTFQIDFARNETGRFGFVQSNWSPPAPPPRPGRRDDDLDIPDRKKIYADIFKQAERELKEAGIMVAGFAVEQLIWWIAGGILLRALSLIGRGVVRGFPYLYRALALKRTTNIARAVATLGEAEAAEFGQLMKRVENGALGAGEQARLAELMGKVEVALGADVPSLRLIGRIGENPSLVREAESLSEAGQRDVDHLVAEYLGGNPNPGIGTRQLTPSIRYLRARNGGRVFFRENAQGYMEVLGKADKGNEDRVINLVLNTFGE